MSTLVIDIPSYLSKTMDWDTTDHGAYLLLLTHYRVNGPFPERVSVMARIIRGEEGDWRMCRDKVARMFVVGEDGIWTHPEMDELIAKAGRARDKATKASKAAHANGAGKPTTLNVIQAEGNDAYEVGVGQINTVVIHRTAPPPPPPEPDPMGTELDLEFSLTGQDILRCSAECPDMETEELAAMVDSFKRYHLAAGTISPDWNESWWKWWERKKPTAAIPRKPRAAPRVEVSRRAEQNDG